MPMHGFDPFVAGLPDVSLTPHERLELLCDHGTVHRIRSSVRSRRFGPNAVAGDGVVGAAGKIGGRPVFCYAQDGRVAGGSLGEAHADTIVRVMRLAREAQVPVVAVIQSAGARVQEATAALAGYARIFRENVALSGRVPQISIVSGTSAGGGSYSPALTDFIVMTRGSSMFLTGPGIVKQTCGEECSAEELGGTGVHQRNGVAGFVVPGDVDAVFLARQLLGYLPQNAWEHPPMGPPGAAPEANPGACVPRDPRQIYDVRDVVGAIVDDGHLLEMSPKWARNIVVGLARLEGRPVGIVANQPRYIGGVLDVQASMKGAKFVRMCNTFGLPLVVLVDTPGFLPGRRQESDGVIRHGATLLHAFAESTVPRLTVVLRQAYGGAYITMNAKDLGADFAYAWPRARIGIMGAAQAVSIVHRRELAEAEDPEALLAELTQAYADEHQNALGAAADGFIDEVIAPSDTRQRLCHALATLGHKVGARGQGSRALP
jgi:acetyl-CoA carboxylase carboxyltransferase component